MNIIILYKMRNNYEDWDPHSEVYLFYEYHKKFTQTINGNNEASYIL